MVGAQTVYLQDEIVTSLVTQLAMRDWHLVEVTQGGATEDVAMTEFIFAVGQSIPYSHRVHIRVSTRRQIAGTAEEAHRKDEHS